MMKGNAAGQSTVSYFNTKRGLTASSLTKALTVDESSMEQPKSDDGTDKPAQPDYFNVLRQEIKDCTDANIRQLMPDYQPAKFSAKRNGIVAAYGANTNQGIVR